MSINVNFYQPNSLIIPQDMDLRRVNARPDKFIDKDYAEDYKRKYDNTTIFYDIFKTENKIYLIGPPLLNLSLILQECYAYDKNGKVTKIDIKTKALERTQLSWIDVSEESTEFEKLRFDFSVFQNSFLQENERFLFVTIGKDFNAYLEDSKALMTLQLDNKLEWISDWAVYYQRIHGVDTVVIYDNNSTAYSPQDIADSLRGIPGLTNVIVVKWNFRYGPQGKPWSGPDTPWDSDFCQIGALQHMRFHFSLKSNGFINADVDELIIPLCDINVFAALESSDSGVIGVEGNTIEGNVSNNVNDDISRFYHFWELKEDKKGGTIKWAGAPKKWNDDKIQVTAHWVRNIKYDLDKRFSVGHFNRINNGWKVKSRAEDNLKVDKSLRPDFALLAALMRAFPDKFSDEILAHALCDAETRIQARAHNSIDFQSGLQSGILLITGGIVQWNKKWVYRENVLVFEAISSSCNHIAFDIVNNNNFIQINLVVRDISYFDKLAQLCLKKDPLISLLANHKGFVIDKRPKKSFKSYEDAARYCSNVLLDWYEIIK